MALDPTMALDEFLDAARGSIRTQTIHALWMWRSRPNSTKPKTVADLLRSWPKPGAVYLLGRVALAELEAYLRQEGCEVPAPRPPKVSARKAARAEREEMLAVLRAVEWEAQRDGDVTCCPVCGGYNPRDPAAPAKRGHAPDCRLDALLNGDR